MATKRLSVTEVRNLARSHVLNSIKGTTDTPTRVYYKGISAEGYISKGGATLEILSNDLEKTFNNILNYFNNPDIKQINDNTSFKLSRSGKDFFKSTNDALIVDLNSLTIDVIPKISRVPILTVLLYSKKYSTSLQKYLDDPNPLSIQIEKDLNLALNHLFNSKVYSKLTEPFKDVFEDLNGKSIHTGLRNNNRNVQFRNNQLEVSSLNSLIADVTVIQPRKTRYISVKYSSGRGKRFFLLSTSALAEYFFDNSDDHYIRTSISQYFGFDGRIISILTNNLENRSTQANVNSNLEKLISDSLGKDIYLYHWTRLKGPELEYFSSAGSDVKINNVQYIYNEAQTNGLVRIVADSVSINNKIYKAEFEFRFKSNRMDLNVFLQSKT
jgi:hypothetical protein